MGMLGSAVKSWHCAAAELLGRLIINPDNEPFLLPFVSQVNFVPHISGLNMYYLCTETIMRAE